MRKYSLLVRFIGIISITSFLASCETSRPYSEKKLKQLIQVTWEFVPISVDDSLSYWEFNESGKLYRTAINSASGTIDTLDAPTYTLEAGITNCYVTISGSKYEAYNGKWSIINLDEQILVIAVKYKEAGGLVEREFSKKK